jgi:peroxiredoxin
MRRLGLASLTVLVLITSLSPVMSSQPEVQLPAPSFTLTDVDGHVFSITDFRGTTVVLSFMVARSVFCKMQVKILVNASRYFGDDVVIIVIGADSQTVTIGGDSDEQLREFKQKCNFTGVVARDTNGVAENYNVTYVPMTFIIDQGGFIRHKHVGVVDAGENILLAELSAIVPEFSSPVILLIAMASTTAAIVAGARRRSGETSCKRRDEGTTLSGDVSRKDSFSFST